LEFFKALDTVDHYDELNGFEWIDDFLKIPDVQKRVSKLKIDRRRVEALPPLKKDVKDRLKLDYKKIQKARIAWLQKYLLEVFDHSKPLFYYSIRAAHPTAKAGFAPHVSLAEIEAAFDLIPEGVGAVSPQKKEELLFVIDKELAELQVKLNRISPPHFFLKRGGRIIGDKRKLFIRAWQTLQAQMSESCGPLGYALTESSKSERKAWDTLCLFEDVNPNGKFVPDPGDG